MKQCRKCEKYKDETEFSKEKQTPDGLRRWCKECSSIEKKKWKSIPENYKKELEHVKKWRRNNTQKHNEICSRWKIENPEKWKKIQRRSYNKDREGKIRYSVDWNRSNIESRKKITKNYRTNHAEEIFIYCCEKYWANPEYYRAKNNINSSKPEYREKSKGRYKKYIDELNDIYIANELMNQGWSKGDTQFLEGLMDWKRATIINHRVKKFIKNKNKNNEKE